MLPHFADSRRLLLVMLLCLGASAAGEHFGDAAPDLAVSVEQPLADSTVHGLVQVSGWAADHRGDARLNPESVSVVLDAPTPGLLGRPLLRLPRGATQTRAAFELGWETCTFPPGPYTLRALAQTDDGLAATDVVEVDVGSCPSAPLSVLRQETLERPTGAWRRGSTPCLSADYAHTSYQLLRSAAGVEPCGVWDSAHVIYGDFVLGVELELPRAEPGDVAVVGFRAQPPSDGRLVDALSGYAVRVDPTARVVQLLRYDEDSSAQVLVSGRLAPADPYYTLQVAAIEDLLAVSVNGRQALLLRDDGPRWGRLYLGLGGETAGATVRYRDLVVRRGPGAPPERLALAR